MFPLMGSSQPECLFMLISGAARSVCVCVCVCVRERLLFAKNCLTSVIQTCVCDSINPFKFTVRSRRVTAG